MRFIIYLVAAICCGVEETSTFWWSIGQVEVNNIPQHVLLNLHQFSRQQKMMIQSTPKLLETIGKGASIAIVECKRQFQYRKWNCSTHTTASVFGNIIDKACRETSFIHAITSAGATYALTESCARGILKDCFCHRQRVIGSPQMKQEDNFIYEGCHDNIQYGYERGKAFVDAAERSRDFHAYVNLHNNEAGRQAVIDSMIIRCRCHGVSGNCNVKTCRKALPLFTEVGKRLVEQYETAEKVAASQIMGNRRVPRNPDDDSISDSVSVNNRGHKKNDLIFLEESPNFCIKNLEDGSLGTHGRYCNSSIRAKGIEGCDVLCCGRPWQTENWTRPERCRCKFIWCCQVTCDECMVTREYSRCQ